MDHSEVKDTRASRSKRIQQKDRQVKRQMKIAKAKGNRLDQPHRYAKHNAMDCGRPQCGLCGNPRWRDKERTIQEKSFDQTKEWVEE
jgi:hypothetical protein